MSSSSESLSPRFQAIVGRAYGGFECGKTRSLAFRNIQLERFLKMITENYEDIRSALMRDLNKGKWEASMFDVDVVANLCRNFIRNLNNLAKPDKLPFNLLGPLDSAYVSRIPYGVVLILATWNLPILLSLHPLLGAIAAGNAVVLKPSEIAHHTAIILTKLIPQYLDNECYQVVYANAAETKELLQFKFDYIYFVGSSAIGKSVLKAAAEHLTPVTLELGGKSPCYIHESADLELTARRIISFKTLNLGQICTGPDYAICHKKLVGDFVRAAVFAIRDLYGPEGTHERNPDLGRIINENHCLRLKRLLETTRGRVVYGGKVDVEDLWVEPTIVVDVPEDDPLMEAEIFGPILPILTANFPRKAIEIINSKPKPLALYVFSKDNSVTQMMLENCPSGTACTNDCGFQFMWNGLPFGGIGNSGMGSHGQGQIGFDAFSHKRGTVERSLSRVNDKLLFFKYPPYSEFNAKLASFGYRNWGRFDIHVGSLVKHLFLILLGYLVCYLQYN